jgi:molybdopterin synthase catalytic subunit
MSVEVSIVDGPLAAAGSPGVHDPSHNQRRPKRKRGLEGAPTCDDPCISDIGDVGAAIVFEGVVRREENGRNIDALEYIAYEPMATMELTKLARDVLERHGLKRVVVEHSRGRVGAGEVSFRLTIASAHRKEGLAAMDAFIDRMKRDVPIWKSPT